MENFRKTASYWKLRYNQTVVLQVPVLTKPVTKEDAIDRLMNDMVVAENRLILLNRKRFSSRQSF